MAELNSKVQVEVLTQTDTTGIDEAEKKIQIFSKNVAEAAKKIAQATSLIGTAAAGALVFSTKSAIDFEDALANVRKTAGLSQVETDAMGKSIMEMSKHTRTSIADLTDIARIGGQLGVARDQLISFTQSVNMATVALGDEFTGGAEQVASELGILANQFKLVNKEGDNIGAVLTSIGSAINSLGASGVATGPYMTDFANRVGGIAPTVGLSIDKVLGLGAAMQELGQSQEVAGTATQQLLIAIGKKSAVFAEIAGMSALAFSKLLKEDINEAMLRVAESVARGTTGVEELSSVLSGLGIDGARAVSVLAAMGNNTDLVRQRQKLAAEEYQKATSLTEEYRIKNETTAAELAKLRNNFEVIANTLGTALLPKINELITALIPVISSFAQLVEQRPQLVTGILATAAALGTIATSVLILTPLVKAFGVIAATAIAALHAPFAPIIGIIISLIAIVGLLYVAWQTNFLGMKDITAKVVDWLSSHVWPTVQNICNWIGAVLITLSQIFINVWSVIIKPLLQAFIEWFRGKFIVSLGAAFGTISAWLEKTGISWESVWLGIKNTVFSILSVIVNEVKSKINSVIGIINSLIDGANSVGSKIPNFTKINTIPMLAEGVRNFSGGFAIVGERGPELVHLPRGSHVIPNNQMGGFAHVTVNQTNYIREPFDMDQAYRELGWRLSLI